MELFTAGAALVSIFTGVWDLYEKTIDDNIRRAWAQHQWEDRAQDYRRKVRKLHGTMQVLGQHEPVQLAGIYTAVNLIDRLTASRRYTIQELESEFAGLSRRYNHILDQEVRHDGLSMVKKGKNLFILGQPGAGKTTFLKHIALRGVNGDLNRVPIFIELKQLSDSGMKVFDFVISEFNVCGFPDAANYIDRLLDSGKAILLFDGLDEVNVANDKRKQLIVNIENFTRRYDKCQRMITCRLAANDFTFKDYTYVEMSDFNEGQIQEFVDKWFSGDEKRLERRDLFLAELRKPENVGLSELARVPLLLTLLCLAFEGTLKLSARREVLYEDALEVLLGKWDASRNIKRDEIYRDLTPKRKRGMLAQVANESFERAEYFIPKKTLARRFEEYLARMPNSTDDIDGEVVLRAIIAQHGLFLERAQDVYSFAHLTFQEYFTSRYIVDNEARGTLLHLIRHYADPRYIEVFLLTAAQLEDGDNFFELFIKQLATDLHKRPTTMEFLNQIERKATLAGKSEVARATWRSYYLSIGLALTRARIIPLAGDHDLTRARDLYRALDLARTIDLARKLTLNNTLSLARDFALARAFALDRILDLGRDRDLARILAHANPIARVRDRPRVRDLGLDRDRKLARAVKEEVALARELAQVLVRDLGQVRSSYFSPARDLALVNALMCVGIGQAYQYDSVVITEWLTKAREFILVAAAQTRKISDETSLAVELDELAGQFSQIIKQGQKVRLTSALAELESITRRCKLDFPNLDNPDYKLLVDYLNGNLLLMECLGQAAVADREAIRGQLLKVT